MVIYKKHNKNTTHIAMKRLKIVKKLIVYNNKNNNNNNNNDDDDDNKSRNKKSPMCLGDFLIPTFVVVVGELASVS